MNVTQVVQVSIMGTSRRYTYGWVFDPEAGGASLAVGDKVVIPPNQVRDEETSATVVALGSDYQGPMKNIISRIGGVGDPKASAPEEDLWGGWESGQY